MNKTRLINTITTITVLSVFLIGCAPNLPIYKDTLGSERVEMVAFKKNDAEFMVPAGWSYEPPAADANEMNLGTWKDGASVITVLCNNQLLMKPDTLRKVAQGMVKGVAPNNNLIKGPYLIDTQDKKASQPIFEAYAGKMISEGQTLDMALMIAWKMPTGMGLGCKYMAFGICPLSNKDDFEKKFIATVRTLKN